ncbi:hypothetical protein SAMN05444412_105230 [Rhodonellum ikkaensis]|uniref:Uncharacterized protein n=1 Tax=Rhodonellum ikkaensis TaxID=336829 RepID=A0A1H3Q544_9BACT|nr:hypothetical protein SAMN05444412_105230 [Rhodonellum ikkaensis]
MVILKFCRRGIVSAYFGLAIYLNLCFYYVLLREYLGKPEKYLKESRHDGYCQTYMGELRSLLQMWAGIPNIGDVVDFVRVKLADILGLYCSGPST